MSDGAVQEILRDHATGTVLFADKHGASRRVHWISSEHECRHATLITLLKWAIPLSQLFLFVCVCVRGAEVGWGRLCSNLDFGRFRCVGEAKDEMKSMANAQARD